MTEKWSKDLNPYKGIIKDGRLYGWGSADDGYAPFFSLFMLKAL